MKNSPPKIVTLDSGTMGLADAEWGPVRALGKLTLHHSTPHADDRAILERIGDAEIVLTNKVPLRAAVLEAVPHLKLVSTLATGYNIIDLDAAKKRGILVCNVPAYSTPAVAQHTMALILELTNRVGHHSAAVQDGAWCRSEFFYFCDYPLVELTGRTLGLVGFGEIAQAVARLASAFGMHILAYRRNAGDPPDFGPFAWADSVDAVFSQSDIVSLHCPLTDATRHMADARRFSLMKPKAFFLNTARGPLVDESALAHALRDRGIAGAALDVAIVEPMSESCPLLGGVPNLIITPHNGWTSLETRLRLLARTASNIQAFLDGNPINRVA